MNKKLPTLADMPDVRGKRVLVRAAFDVPIEEGKVVNAFRIVRALPTITALTAAGARVIIISHIGRDPRGTLAPVYDVLKEQIPLTYIPALRDKEVAGAVAAMQDGDVLLLENLRSDEGEKANDPAFAAELASYADYYVNDAFSVAHRAHASIVGIAPLLPSFVGNSFEEEYTELQKAMEPKPPALFILGGAKFDTKSPLVEQYLETYDHVFVGGALANDFFKARGYEIGQSLHSDIDLANSPLLTHPKILLPIDVTTVSAEGARTTAPDNVRPDEKILDAGPDTIAMLAKHIKAAKTILWNGPLGDYEHDCEKYTLECAKLVAESDAYSIIGGGDTIAAIEPLGLGDQFSFLSTAGGAMLVFLETGTLPGIDAILKK